MLADVDGDRLAATAGELKGEVHHLRADVTRLPEIDAVFELAEREFGRIDGLVTCAGIITTLPLLEVTAEEWIGSSRSTPRAPSSRSRRPCAGCSRAARDAS